MNELASIIIEKVGGIDNISSATHCVTRLRFILVDKEKADTMYLKKLDGILGVVYGSGQYQIVLGANVLPIFNIIEKEYGINTGDKDNNNYIGKVESVESVESNEKAKKRLVYYMEKITRFLSSSLTPFITVLYGAGMLKIVLSLLSYFLPSLSNNATYIMFNLFTETPFYFMPILIAYGSAKTLKSNPIFAITVSAMLLYPNFTSLLEKSGTMTFFGLPVLSASYSNTLLPAIMSTILLAKLEKYFYKIIPPALCTILAPLCILTVALPIVLVVLAPIGIIIGNNVVNIFVWISNITGGISIGLLAAVWPFILMGGMNMLFVAPMTELLASSGYDNLFRPAWILHNVAEGGACIGVALKTKNKKFRSDAIAAAVSAIVSGVSEPALYGINLRLKRPLIAVVIGGLAGGSIAGFLGARAYALVYSSILSIPVFEDTIIAIIYAIVASFLVSFIIAFILGFDDIEEGTNKINEGNDI